MFVRVIKFGMHLKEFVHASMIKIFAKTVHILTRIFVSAGLIDRSVQQIQKILPNGIMTMIHLLASVHLCLKRFAQELNTSVPKYVLVLRVVLLANS